MLHKDLCRSCPGRPIPVTTKSYPANTCGGMKCVREHNYWPDWGKCMHSGEAYIVWRLRGE